MHLGAYVAALPNLTYLDCPIIAPVTRAWQANGAIACSGLTSLTCANADFPMTDSILLCLSQLRCVRELDIHQCRVTTAGVRALGAMQSLTRVSLQFPSFCPLTGKLFGLYAHCYIACDCVIFVGTRSGQRPMICLGWTTVVRPSQH